MAQIQLRLARCPTCDKLRMVRAILTWIVSWLGPEGNDSDTSSSVGEGGWFNLKHHALLNYRKAFKVAPSFSMKLMIRCLLRYQAQLIAPPSFRCASAKVSLNQLMAKGRFYNRTH